MAARTEGHPGDRARPAGRGGAPRVSARAGRQPAARRRHGPCGLRPSLDQLRGASRRAGQGRSASRAAQRPGRPRRRRRGCSPRPPDGAQGRRAAARWSSSATSSAPSGPRPISPSSPRTPRSGSNPPRAAETPANLAVLRVGGTGRAEVGRPLALEVDVGNFSTAARPVELELSRSKTASYRAERPLRGGGEDDASRPRSCRAPPAGRRAGPG